MPAFGHFQPQRPARWPGHIVPHTYAKTVRLLVIRGNNVVRRLNLYRKRGPYNQGPLSLPVKRIDILHLCYGVYLTGGARPPTMGHGKGNIFIVSRGNRTVVWSIYEPPKNNTSRELTKTAERVVKHLQEDLNPKKPAAE